MIRIANVNTHRLHRGALPTPRGQSLVTAIRELNADILTVQEVLVDDVADSTGWDRAAAGILLDLAAECGLSVALPHGGTAGVAMATNVHRPWYTAILWNPATVAPVKRSFRAYGAPDFWHGLTTLQFDIGGVEPFLVASYHGDPIRPDGRFGEALRLKSVFRRTGGPRPGIAAGDYNAVSAARIPDSGGARRFYDAEPYTGQVHDDLEYQCLPETVGATNMADRRQTEALLRNDYLVDSAAYLNAPWRPTVGHWADGQGDPDPWGERRIDLVLATRPVAPALVRYRVHVTKASEEAADHRPVYVDIDPSKASSKETSR
ncbi:endonuclease/exonuclease/phosphatase family protein [Kitasatospora sp. NPDC058190]|uniref:endonuclease/exonuclease/phosphatase family protein n=1 Tax=Kitasatospora sp. NPDC058190 TaxID=3346371 RepID=UPI0036DEE20D